MYLKYFGLNEPPFSITPDPRFVFLSARHEDALAHLKYGIAQGGGGGFVQLTGEVGTGKTTLSRLLLEELPDDTVAALILNPLLEPTQLLESICEELGVNVRAAWGNSKKLTDRLNKYLLKAHADGKTVVVLIDEAQNLSPAALEQVRLLTNLETATQKLLQIVLLGQPELREVLGRADLRQLAQRITARYHLQPLDASETADYVTHRMKVAGADGIPFSAGALSALHKATGGVPRLINIVAERALLAAYARNRRTIDAATVRRAAAEIRGEAPGRRRRQAPVRSLAFAALVVLVAGATAGYFGGWLGGGVPVDAPRAAAETEPPSTADDAGSAPNAPAQTRQEPKKEPEAEPDRLPVSDFEGAWTSLLASRNLEAVPADRECRWQLDGPLYCLEARGRLDELLRLKRPVLAAVNGGYGIVVATGPDTLEWRAAGQTRRLGAMTFESHWSGRFWDIWRMPGYIPELLEEGDRGPGVLWVKSAAVRAEPRYLGDPGDPYFGPSLKRWAVAFQEAAGLPADGMIGPETLQYLSTFTEG